ncbi:hypothetical protein [Streptococcus merionis]|uniref:Uncharacterized protein n=1 Tax=Streptococcus merionis TaxID=400065 RepID=A0A239T223_9STRE|nr:hypothetical protein [Streptococcus merionis]SNU90994.1 Uncharacterised protein [Streptococcus merionis]
MSQKIGIIFMAVAVMLALWLIFNRDISQLYQLEEITNYTLTRILALISLSNWLFILGLVLWKKKD